MADAVNELDNVTVLNRVNITDYAVENNHINGAFGIGIENDTFYVIKAKAVIIAADTKVDLSRFDGKKLVKAKVADTKCGIHHLIPVQVLQWVSMPVQK